MRPSFFLVLLVLLIPFATALGVTPAIKNVVYSPGESATLSFEIWNNEPSDSFITIESRGPLAPSIHLSETSFTLPPQSWHTVTYTITFPRILSGTSSSFFVTASPPPQPTQLGVVPRLQIETQIRLLLPEAVVISPSVPSSASAPPVSIENVSLENYNSNTGLTFSLFVTNHNTSPSAELTARVEMRDSNDNLLTLLTSPSFSIPSQSTSQIPFALDRATALPGVYTLFVQLHQGSTAISETQTTLRLTQDTALFSVSSPSSNKKDIFMGVLFVLALFVLSSIFYAARHVKKR